jgi:hypothetical protein
MTRPDTEPGHFIDTSYGKMRAIKRYINDMQTNLKSVMRYWGLTLGLGLLLSAGMSLLHPPAYAATETGSVGLEGRINSAPPTQGASITFPRDGSSITSLPTTITGICPTGLLVKIFKNNVFAGSVQCVNGSFSIQIDLFSGRNELIARVFDELDQPGPDSNTVVVSFPIATVGTTNRIALTSTFAKRGANPGQTLTWPIILTGGTSPYAITVDWGDGKKPDVISQSFPGSFNITHVYDSAGVYNIIIRATDKEGSLAFLQLVGVANGPVGQNAATGSNSDKNAATVTRTKILWQPAAIAIPLIIISFWLGKKYELYILRKRLDRHEDVS